MIIYRHEGSFTISNKIQYQFDPENNQLSSHNPIVLQAIINHFKIERANLIGNVLKIQSKTRRLMLNFINKLRLELINLDNEEELSFFLKYINNQIQMIIQVTDKQKQSKKWVAVFDDKGDTLSSKIRSFKVLKVSIPKFAAQKNAIIQNIIQRPISVFVHVDKELNNQVNMYGDQHNLKLYNQKYKQVFQQIKCRKFQKGDKTINNYMWAYMRNFSQSFLQTKMITNENQSQTFILYRQRSSFFFDEKDIPQIDEIASDVILPYFKKDKELKDFVNKSPDLIYIKQFKLVGLKPIIGKIKKIIADDKEQYKESNVAQMSCRILKIVDLNINQNNYKQFLSKIQSFKCIEKLSYYIDLEGFRVTNRAKEIRKIFIIFHEFFELIQLQSLIDINWSMKSLNEIINKLQQDFYQLKHKIIAENKVEIVLLRRNENIDWKQFIDTINSSNEIGKILVFKKQYFSEFMSYSSQIKSRVTIVIQNFIGNMAGISEKMINNIESYKVLQPAASIKESLDIVKYILKCNIRSDIYKGYLLDPISCYNLQKMRIQKIKTINLILSKNQENKFVYFTFFEKLYLIVNDDKGNFKDLQEVKVTEKLRKLQENILKNKIKQSLVYGYHFFYICNLIELTEPITSSSKIEKVIKNDHLTLLYWQIQFRITDKYDLQLPISLNESFLLNNFVKMYQITLYDQLLVKMLQNIKIGYDNLIKSRCEGGISIKGSSRVLQGVVQECLKIYSK